MDIGFYNKINTTKPYISSGRWYTWQAIHYSVSARTYSNYILLTPFIPSRNIKINKIGTRALTATVTTLKCGIYDSLGSEGLPLNLIVSAPTINCNAIADYTASITETTLMADTLYWTAQISGDSLLKIAGLNPSSNQEHLVDYIGGVSASSLLNLGLDSSIGVAGVGTNPLPATITIGTPIYINDAGTFYLGAV